MRRIEATLAKANMRYTAVSPDNEKKRKEKEVGTCSEWIDHLLSTNENDGVQSKGKGAEASRESYSGK